MAIHLYAVIIWAVQLSGKYQQAISVVQQIHPSDQSDVASIKVRLYRVERYDFSHPLKLSLKVRTWTIAIANGKAVNWGATASRT